jgi:hypothetical protein
LAQSLFILALLVRAIILARSELVAELPKPHVARERLTRMPLKVGRGRREAISAIFRKISRSPGERERTRLSRLYSWRLRCVNAIGALTSIGGTGLGVAGIQDASIEASCQMSLAKSCRYLS